MSTEARPPGRIVVTTRAQRAVLQALAADRLGVAPRSVSVAVSDDRGRLAAEITAPVDIDAVDGTVLDTVASARRVIRDEGRRLTGAEISRVGVRITETITRRRMT